MQLVYQLKSGVDGQTYSVVDIPKALCLRGSSLGSPGVCADQGPTVHAHSSPESLSCSYPIPLALLA